MGTQFIAAVIEADEVGFQLRNMEGVVWLFNEESYGRIEKGDVATIELERDLYPWLGDKSVFTEEDRTSYKLIRVSKGGNPAFQG